MRFRREVLPFVEEIRFPTLYRVLRDDGVGRKIPIPMPVVKGEPDRIYSPLYYLKAVLAFRSAKCERLPGNLIRDPSTDLVLDFYCFHVMPREYPLWLAHYKPPANANKVVLDAGAGCGETAHLFFSLGAEKVIAIEPSPSRFKILERNARAHRWNIELINDKLRKEHILKTRFDFAKIDVEGGEVELLSLSGLPPSVIEVHSDSLRQAFADKFGFRTVWTNHRGLSLIRND